MNDKDHVSSNQSNDPGERRFLEARVTKEAGMASSPIVGRPEPFSAGLLLYSYVYEARWAGLRTAEICPRWKDLPDSFRLSWEQLARELAARASRDETTQAPFPYPCDRTGWICSICHQWNLPKDKFCSHESRSATDSPEEPTDNESK